MKKLDAKLTKSAYLPLVSSFSLYEVFEGHDVDYLADSEESNLILTELGG